MNYQEAMDYISGTAKFGSKLGLQRMECIMAELGNPEKKLKCIHIAGTNGKGSVAAIMADALQNAGFRTGLYTSPYIEVFEERIQINREYITHEDLANYTERVSHAVSACVENGCDHPTEFEIITSVMFLYFAEMNIDYAVIEVGLGGDLDSTNVCIPVISVITSLSMDHMQVLGNTMTDIARAKAGIIKDAPVVSYDQIEEARAVIDKTAEEKNVSLKYINPEDATFISFNEKKNKQVVSYKTMNWDFTSELNLIGVHQVQNSLLAVTALDILNSEEKLGLNEKLIKKTLENVFWVGRMEVMHKNPLILIDGAHNEDGIKKLKESLDRYYPGRNYILILGILADKETHKMADIIAKDAKRVICVTPHSIRASLAKDLYEYIVSFNDNTTWKEDYEEAIEDAENHAEGDDLIIISGSLYMIGSMRTILVDKYHKK